MIYVEFFLSTMFLKCLLILKSNIKFINCKIGSRFGLNCLLWWKVLFNWMKTINFELWSYMKITCLCIWFQTWFTDLIKIIRLGLTLVHRNDKFQRIRKLCRFIFRNQIGKRSKKIWRGHNFKPDTQINSDIYDWN